MFINKPRRHREHDYNLPGSYFITICTRDRKRLFGQIKKGKMVLNQMGLIAQRCLNEIEKHSRNVKLNLYTVMPNHIHFILEVFDLENDVRRCQVLLTSKVKKTRQYSRLSIIVGSFKSAVTKEINNHFSENDFKWQRSFYDRIIRNEKEFENIQRYIVYNPLNWTKDPENETFLNCLSEKERGQLIDKIYEDVFEKVYLKL